MEIEHVCVCPDQSYWPIYEFVLCPSYSILCCTFLLLHSTTLGVLKRAFLNKFPSFLPPTRFNGVGAAGDRLLLPWVLRGGVDAAGGASVPSRKDGVRWAATDPHASHAELNLGSKSRSSVKNSPLPNVQTDPDFWSHILWIAALQIPHSVGAEEVMLWRSTITMWPFPYYWE